MIDRINETAKLRAILDEELNLKTIVIWGDEGAGASCFVNENCSPLLQLNISKNIEEDFAQSLIKSVISKFGDEFYEFLKKVKVENLDYRLIDPNLNNDDIIATLTNSYKKNAKFRYALVRDGKRKNNHLAADYIERSFPNLLYQFLTTSNVAFIIYDKFDNYEDSIAVKQFISKTCNKTNIIITNSFLFYDNYPFVIRLKKFEDKDAKYFSELLGTLVTFSSASALERLSNDLRVRLNGSPKALILLINSCKSEIHDCNSDDEIIYEISEKCNSDNIFLNKLNNKQILLLLYFSQKKLPEDILRKVFEKPYASSLETITILKNTLNGLAEKKLIEPLYSSYYLTDQGIAEINLKILTLENKQFICAEMLAYLNQFKQSERLNNEDLLRIFCNLLLFSGIKEASNVKYVIKYAEELAKTNKRKAAEFYAFSSDDIYFENYDAAYAVAELLYNEGYYAECNKILERQNIEDLNKDTLFKHYLILGNCNSFANNDRSVQYYQSAIDLNTEERLIALSCKFVAMGESKNRNVFELNSEYLSTINDTDNEDKIGYISILRNALDFQINADAIETMEKALTMAEEENCCDEIYKIRQNLALNLIKEGRLDDAEKHLNYVLGYCGNYEIRDISYPLINLAVLNIYKYLETDEAQYISKAYEYTMQATDHASTFYSKILSRLHMLTSLSLLYSLENNPFNISLVRIENLQQNLFDTITASDRNDFRTAVKTFLGLITCAKIRNDMEKARYFLKYLCENYGSFIGKEAFKVNKFIAEFGEEGMTLFPEQTLDPTCIKHQQETRFEAWMISLTHM